MLVKIKKLDPRAVMPRYATDGSGAFDLFAFEEEDRSIAAATILLRTGLAFEIPQDHVMLIFSRSGHGFKHNTRLSNCVGVIDSDYRGEVKVQLRCDYSFATSRGRLDTLNGNAIAQAIVIPIPRIQFQEVDELSTTVRGAGGFGSTDKINLIEPQPPISRA